MPQRAARFPVPFNRLPCLRGAAARVRQYIAPRHFRRLHVLCWQSRVRENRGAATMLAAAGYQAPRILHAPSVPAAPRRRCPARASARL